MGLVMALALLGDALIYVALPASALALGLPLWSVGVLLAANRIVRLGTNSWVAHLVRLHGGKRLLVAAAVGATATTAIYGLLPSFWPMLAARLGWGWCFSTLRLCGLSTVMAASTPATRGRTLGVYQSMSHLAYPTSLIGGALLLEGAGFSTTFLLLAVPTAVAVPLALTIDGALLRAPAPSDGPDASPLGWRERWLGGRRLTAVKTAGLAAGFAIQVGASTFALAVAAAAGGTEGAAAIAGLVLGGRWIADILLSPLFGRLSDGRDRGRILVALLFGQALLLLGAGAAATANALPREVALAAVVGAGLLLFTAATAYRTTADAAVGDLIPEGRRAEMLSAYADWLDVGSAAGPLLAFLVADALGLGAAYAVAAAALTAAATNLLLAWHRPEQHQPLA
jgi:MFS family permease